jgi:hypothetical protein
MHRVARLSFFVVALVAVTGCDGTDGGAGKGNNKRMQTAMVKSSGKFNEGYQAGLRDAQQSWTDWNANDMWLWMADQQYQGGYQRGWNDGRNMARMQSHQRKQMGDRESSSPMTDLRLRNQPGEKTVAPRINDASKSGAGSKKESSE